MNDLTEKFIWAELKYKLYGIAVNIENDDYLDQQQILSDVKEVLKILESTNP